MNSLRYHRLKMHHKFSMTFPGILQAKVGYRIFPVYSSAGLASCQWLASSRATKIIIYFPRSTDQPTNLQAINIYTFLTDDSAFKVNLRSVVAPFCVVFPFVIIHSFSFNGQHGEKKKTRTTTVLRRTTQDVLRFCGKIVWKLNNKVKYFIPSS